MTESFSGGGTGITSDSNSLIFEVLSLLLKYRLSWGVLCEDMDDCWRTEDSWYGLMTELLNVGGTFITDNEKSFLFEWMTLWLKHRLLRGFVRCLPWFFLVQILWRQPIPFLRGMMNKIWVCGEIACLLFCFSISIKRWEPMFWRNNYSHVWVYVPEIKIDYEIFVSISS